MVDELRPIMLIEILRKCWTSIKIKRIMSVLDEQGVLSDSQHVFRRGRGTYTANLHLKNAIETAWQRRTKLYGSSWDIKKGFDSVSDAIIRLA